MMQPRQSERFGLARFVYAFVEMRLSGGGPQRAATGSAGVRFREFFGEARDAIAELIAREFGIKLPGIVFGGDGASRRAVIPARFRQESTG